MKDEIGEASAATRTDTNRLACSSLTPCFPFRFSLVSLLPWWQIVRASTGACATRLKRPPALGVPATGRVPPAPAKELPATCPQFSVCSVVNLLGALVVGIRLAQHGCATTREVGGTAAAGTGPMPAGQPARPGRPWAAPTQQEPKGLPYAPRPAASSLAFLSDSKVPASVHQPLSTS
jgi:hypothetical protein